MYHINNNAFSCVLIRHTKLIVWDEAPMSHRHLFDALDRTLRDIMEADKLFGDKVLLLAGDFRQILPYNLADVAVMNNMQLNCISMPTGCCSWAMADFLRHSSTAISTFRTSCECHQSTTWSSLFSAICQLITTTPSRSGYHREPSYARATTWSTT